MLWIWIEIIGFGHMVRHCRNMGVSMNWRIEHEENRQSNLIGDKGLISPN